MKRLIKTFCLSSVAFLLCILTPITGFAIDDYQTDTSKHEYWVKDNNQVTQTADTDQTAAINAMRARALYSWEITDNYWYYKKYLVNNTEGNELSLPQGKYRGILYEQKAFNSDNTSAPSREWWLSSSGQVQAAVNDMINNGDRYVKGTDCSSSVCYAWRSAINGNDRTNGVLMSTSSRYANKYRTAYTCLKIVKDGNDTQPNTAEGYGNYVTRVGQYGQAANNLSNNTYTMLSRLKENGNFTNNATVYQRVYAKMLPGDFIVRSTASGAHAKLVEKVVIVRDSNGSIDPDESFVVTTEQNSKVYTCHNNGIADEQYREYKTTWLVSFNGLFDGDTNKNKFTFKKLATGRNQYYLPYRYNGNVASAVLGFVVPSVTNDSIEVNWSANDESFCSGYELLLADNLQFDEAKVINIDNPEESSLLLDELDETKTYYIKMRSFYVDEEDNIEYSGYNNWLRINMETKQLYRENAPVSSRVPISVYNNYVYNDIASDEYFDNDECNLLDVPFYELSESKNILN